MTAPLASFAALVCLTANFGAHAATNDPVCRDVTVKTGLSGTAPQTVSVYGQYCLPAGSVPKTVQLLVHGATYSHIYWNFPGFGGYYS